MYNEGVKECEYVKAYFETTGHFDIKDATISYTIVYNCSGTDYAQSPHYHSSYELQYMITDGWCLYDNHKSTRLDAGTVCVFSPFYLHHFIPESNDEKCRKISLKFSLVSTGNKHGEIGHKIERALSAVNCAQILFESDLKQLFSVLEGFYYGDYKYELLVCNIVSALILCIVDHYEKLVSDTTDVESHELSDADHGYAIMIEDLIASKYADSEFSLSDLSRVLCLSDRHAQRLCKKIFGCSFTRLLTGHRMIIASILIGEGNLSMSEIALKVGFCSYSGFYKCYKSYYKTNPKNKKQS
jgi:AraC-like DNA-binding protein